MKESFLHSVADELIRRFGWEGLKDVSLVFPMHRAGVVMRSVLQQRMASEHPEALWAPEMLSLSDLFDSLCPLGKEDELFTVCRLHRIYQANCPQPMEIDRFYGWGRQLLSDFTNIDQGIEEKEIESFFRNALTLSDLDTYKLDEDVRRRLEDLLYKGEARRQALIAESVQAHFAALWKAMPTIYHTLRDELLKEGKGYEGQRMRYVISHWDELSSRADKRTYCFIGFNYLLPVEHRLMQLLHREGRALFFWDYVEDFRTNSKAFAFIRRNMTTLPNALPAQSWGAPRTVRTVSVTSTHAEAQFAGQWLQQTYRHKGEATAVVICDELQLEPVIYSLPPVQAEGSERPEDVNITKGFPLRHAAIYAQLVKQLDAGFRKHKEDLLQALQNAVDFVDEQSTQSIAAQENTWQWHLGREALYQTRRTLVQFMLLLRDGRIGELATHLDLLKRLILRHLEQLTLPFHGEPVTDLQIMGVLETRTLDFKHLLLLNVEEGVLPATQPDKSFLPYYLRKAYGLQTHDERASVYAYNFFRLLNRAEDVTILFSQSQTQMTKKSMSRFVMQMLVCPEEFSIQKFTLTESNTLQSAGILEVTEGANWLSARRQKGRPLHLSPSAINTFFACKRKFYIEYILGLREDDEPETIFTNRTLGLFVHEAIHYLYRTHCQCDNQRPVRIYPNSIEAMNTPEQRQLALAAAYEALNDAHGKEHPGEPAPFVMEQHAMENRVIDTYIAHVLERDRYDAEHGGLTILLLESPQYASLQLPNADETVTVSLGGRIDRMDRTGGDNGVAEVTRIVDYKCGHYNEKKMSVKEDDLLNEEKTDADYVRQTLLYSLVVFAQGKVAAVEPHLYFTSQDLTNAKTQTRVYIDKSPVLYDHENHASYSELIRRMVAAIIAEREFPLCQKCSTYCPFLLLCGRKV